MGAWSGEPFGNDVATDWAWDLEEADDWWVVRSALAEAAAPEAPLDEDTAAIALAAAEVVARALGRPTQDDAYTEDVKAFVARVAAPDRQLVDTAIRALDRAADPDGALGRLWAEGGDEAWRESVGRIAGALRR